MTGSTMSQGEHSRGNACGSPDLEGGRYSAERPVARKGHFSAFLSAGVQARAPRNPDLPRSGGAAKVRSPTPSPTALMEEARLHPTCRVLIVDHSPESREVLRTALEREGAQALEAAHPSEAALLSRRTRPDLIVLDLDSDPSEGQQAARELSERADLRDTPIVVLGAVNQESTWTSGGEFVPKPYHYGPLLRRIESMLASRRAAA